MDFSSGQSLPNAKAKLQFQKSIWHADKFLAKDFSKLNLLRCPRILILWKTDFYMKNYLRRSSKGHLSWEPKNHVQVNAKTVNGDITNVASELDMNFCTDQKDEERESEAQ